MRLLDAVNQILPKLGEHPVTGLEIRHPTLAVVLPEIEQASVNLQLKGWWFNEFESKLYPDHEGTILLGTNTLKYVPYSEFATVRGEKLYNTATRTYVWDAPVEGVLTELVPFEDLPETAANAVLYSALVAASVQDLGMTQDVQAWMTLSAQASSDLLAEHLRQRKHSTRNSRRYRRLVAALRGS